MAARCYLFGKSKQFILREFPGKVTENVTGEVIGEVICLLLGRTSVINEV